MNHVLTFCAAEEEEAAVGELGQVLWRRVGPELDGPVLGRVGHVLGRAQPPLLCPLFYDPLPPPMLA